MAEITLKPIVVPRGWDGQKLHFALVFVFEMNPPGNAPPGGSFENWPEHLEALLQSAGASALRLTVTPDGASSQDIPITRSGTFDLAKSNAAWSAIFDGTWRKRFKSRSPTASPLAEIFTKHEAPSLKASKGGDDRVDHGRDVSTNPDGASDLRPTQRIESLEMPHARIFLAAPETHAEMLRTAHPHDLARAKTAAFKMSEPISRFLQSQAARREVPIAFAAGAPELEGVPLALAAAALLAQKAGSDGARLQRSVGLARNRPATSVNPDQVTQPTTSEILGRFKQHPSAMRVLGLVVDCSAPFQPIGGSPLIRGEVEVKLAGLVTGAAPQEIATRFVLQPDPSELFYFRAEEREPGDFDDAHEVWRRFHLLPPSFFSLRQDDHVRSVMRAQQGARSPSAILRDAEVGDALTDAIIIQAEHGIDGSVAKAIRRRLIQAQRTFNGPGNGKAPKQEKKTLLHAEDLMSGVTFDAAVLDANGRIGAWHSLCHRRLRVTAAGKLLFDCEEDGYVSTSVSISAQPLVGGILSLTPSPVPDHSSLDKYDLQIVEDGAYNTPSSNPSSPGGFVVTSPRQKPRTAAELAKASAQDRTAAQATQLRGIFRDVVTAADLKVNPPAVPGRDLTTEGHDRTHLTIGPPVGDKDPTFVESLFLSPLFSTDALDDPELPQTGLQVFRGRNDLRNEYFQFAFDGAVTAFLNSDGTEFKPKVKVGKSSWLPDAFSTFEAEGERRAYLRTASDLAVGQSLFGLTDAGRITAVLSDSLPQAALTADHAVMQGGKVTLLPLPFVPPGKSHRFFELKSPEAVYPLQFRFRGKVVSASPTGGDATTIDLRFFGINDAADAPALICPAGVMTDRAGHGAALDSGRAGWVPMIVSGDGVLERPGGPFTAVQLHVLGEADAASGEAAIAGKDPFFAWMPRVARLEENLQRVRGPVDGRIGFDVAGKIKADSADRNGGNRFVLASSPDTSDARNAFVTVSWPDIVARLPTKVVLPVGLTAAAPVNDLIVSASGRVEDVVFLNADGTRKAAAETVLLLQTWNVLASGSIRDEDLSDEARSAKASPHLDWVVTVTTDDRGAIPVYFDAMRTPANAAIQFHPLDLRLPNGTPDPQPIWVEVVCVDQVGRLRGLGWPGWIAGYAKATGAGNAARTLTLLDLRTLKLEPTPGDDGKDLNGFFRLVGPRGDVKWAGVAPAAAAFVKSAALLRLLGEVVSSDIDANDCVLQLSGLTGKTPWQLRVRCAPEDRFGDILPEVVSRRAVDLLPGDCVFALVRPDPQGWYQLIGAADDPDAPAPPKDATNPVALASGLFGEWRPPALSSQAISKAVVAFGGIDFLPGTVKTPRGAMRTVWAPRPTPSADRGRSAPLNLLVSGETVSAAMLRHLPLAFVRTLIAHAKPQALSVKAGAAPEAFPAVHAVVSDAWARWRGWSLTVPQPGASDATSDPPADGWPIRLECLPAGLMLPLRAQRTYLIRTWRTDIAGNNGYDALDAKAQQALERLLVRDPHLCAQTLENFKRPDAPLAPIMAQTGKTFGEPGFDYVGYDLAIDSSKRPGLSLVLVTKRDGMVTAPRGSTAQHGTSSPLYNASAYLLPPPVDVETVLSSGKLDHEEHVERTIYQYERFYDDHVFGRRPRDGLNYFPDPFAMSAVLRVAETLPSALLLPTGSTDGPKLGPWSRSDRDLSFFPRGKWPKGDVPSRIELATGMLGVHVQAQHVTFRLPPARVAQAQIVAVEASPAARTTALAGGLTLDLIHAVTGPLRQPQWLSFAEDPPRKAADTAQAFRGDVGVDVPSTGSIGFSLYWSDLWDETVPALFGPARVRALAAKGKIARVVVEDMGFGYGHAAVVRAIGAGVGAGATLLPVVKDGKLISVNVKEGGAGFPDGEIAVVVGRRPPLYALASAVAKVDAGRIIEVSLADGAAENGYYARPPLVRFHDMKGTGVDADCEAVVVDGRVTGFKIGKTGRDYSNDVRVGLYTAEAVVQDQAVDDRTNLADPAWSHFPFTFSHAFGDTRARHLYVVGQARTRFREEVAEEEPMTTEPRRFEVVSSARPPKPEIAHLLHSFQPVGRLEAPTGRLIEQHDGMIRCYLHRPWNATGDEKLGVVVFAAQVNTTRVTEDAKCEGLIPGALRKYVTRWGFDPVWDDVAMAPLTLDDFTSAVDVERYDDLAELSWSEKQPVGVALHETHFNAARDMWFADVAIRPPQQSQPFVQLALVRYQPSSVQGLSMSEVALADAILLPARRRISIRRSASAADIEITGNFEGPRAPARKQTSLPKRKFVVELRKRSTDRPVEIEGDLAFSDGSDGADSLDRWELQRSGTTRFSGRVPLEGRVLARPQAYYFAMKEFEVYSTAASFRDRTGSADVIVDGHPAFEKLVFYRRLDVVEILNA